MNIQPISVRNIGNHTWWMLRVINEHKIPCVAIYVKKYHESNMNITNCSLKMFNITLDRQ